MGRVFRTQLGDVSVTAFQDTWVRMPPQRMILPEIEADFTPYRHFEDSEGLAELSMTSFLLESGGRRILVDTGLADQEMPRSAVEEPPGLPDLMEEAGVALDSIDVVIHTHLHFDHIGWNTRLVDGVFVPTFPNARHHIQRVEWDYWMGDGERNFGPDYDRHLGPLEEAGMIEFVDGDNHAVTSEVSIIHARGHTPGHQAVRIASGDGRGYVIGDSCHVPAQACEPSWSSAADVDPDAAAVTREALFQRIEDEGALILSGHFPFPGIGRRVTEDHRRDYRPIPQDETQDET